MNDDMIAARIDRLPIAGFHRRLLLLISLPFFFDISDIFTFSYAAPALIKEWQLKVDQIALVTSIGFLGMFLGASLGGMLSDRIGRKRSLILYVLIYSIFSLANGLAPNITFLLVARLLTGLGISSATAVIMTYIAEMFPAKTRGSWQGWAMLIALTGIPITSWVALLVLPSGPDGWRWIFVWGSLGIVFLAFVRHLPESPRWLARKGRVTEAEQVIGHIESLVAREKGPLPAAIPLSQAATTTLDWKALFKPPYASRTFTLWAIWMFQTLGFYGFHAWVPTLLVQHGNTMVNSLTYVTLINLGAIPGALLATAISDRIERKVTISITALVISVLGVLYGLSSEPAMIVIFGFGVAMLLQTFAVLCYAYTPEQYPTDIRSTGTGLAYGMGRLVNVGSAFVVAFIFQRYGYVWVFVYIAGTWLAVAFIASIFGARMTGRRLEVAVSDGEAGSSLAHAPRLVAKADPT
jgi:putative MFS transporter